MATDNKLYSLASLRSLLGAPSLTPPAATRGGPTSHGAALPPLTPVSVAAPRVMWIKHAMLAAGTMATTTLAFSIGPAVLFVGGTPAVVAGASALAAACGTLWLRARDPVTGRRCRLDRLKRLVSR